MSISINRAEVLGRIAGEPKFFEGTEPSKNRLLFKVAVNDFRKEKPDFIPVVLWGGAAVNGKKYLAVGKEVHVIGKMSCHWDAGKNKEYFSLSATEIQYGNDSKKKQQQAVSDTEASDEVVAALQETKSTKDLVVDRLMTEGGLSKAEAEKTIEDHVIAKAKINTAPAVTNDTPF
jgi:single-stranded DNA-binding protein